MNTSSRAYDVVRKHDRVSSRSLSTRTPRARDPHVTATRALGGASASAPRLSSRRVRGATHPRRRRAHRGNPGEGKAAWISATRTSSRARDARTRPFRPTQQRRAFFCKASRSRTEPPAHASSCSESARRRSRARRVGAPPPRRVARHRANARRRPRNPRRRAGGRVRPRLRGVGVDPEPRVLQHAGDEALVDAAAVLRARKPVTGRRLEDVGRRSTPSRRADDAAVQRAFAQRQKGASLPGSARRQTSESFPRRYGTVHATRVLMRGTSAARSGFAAPAPAPTPGSWVAAARARSASASATGGGGSGPSPPSGSPDPSTSPRSPSLPSATRAAFPGASSYSTSSSASSRAVSISTARASSRGESREDPNGAFAAVVAVRTASPAASRPARLLSVPEKPPAAARVAADVVSRPDERGPTRAPAASVVVAIRVPPPPPRPAPHGLLQEFLRRAQQRVRARRRPAHVVAPRRAAPGRTRRRSSSPKYSMGPPKTLPMGALGARPSAPRSACGHEAAKKDKILLRRSGDRVEEVPRAFL